jgi:hypothetical protein
VATVATLGDDRSAEVAPATYAEPWPTLLADEFHGHDP